MCRTQNVSMQSLGVRFPTIASQIAESIDAFTLSPHSKQCLTWRCGVKCCDTEHVWTTSVCSRTRGPTGCPFCSGRQTCRCTSVGALHPDIASQFVDRELNLFSIGPSSNKLFDFRCQSCKHVWKASLNNRTGVNKTGCPSCNLNKAEARLKCLLDSNQEEPRVMDKRL